MRKITKEAINAFLRNENYKKSNTIVDVTDNYVKMYLHGNLIAIKGRIFNNVSISNCGYFHQYHEREIKRFAQCTYQTKEFQLVFKW